MNAALWVGLAKARTACALSPIATRDIPMPATEFRKFEEYGVNIGNSPSGAVAQLQLARACVTSMRHRYGAGGVSGFSLDLEDADTDMCILQEANAEWL